MKRLLIDAEYFGGGGDPKFASEFPSAYPSPFALSDEGDSRRLHSSNWVAHVLLRPRPGHPTILPTALSQAAGLLAGRCAHVDADRQGDVHLTFLSWDGSEHSHQFARDAGKAAAALLELVEPETTDVDIEQVDRSPEKVARLLAEAGVARFPRPQLSVVPSVPTSADTR